MPLRWAGGNLLAIAPLLGAVIITVYGALSGSLVVHGQAQTGDFDALWTGASCREFHTWPAIPNPDNPADSGAFGEYLGKDVGATVVSGTNGDVLEVTTSDGYPSYGVRCALEYENTGSLPIRVGDPEVLALGGLTGCTTSGTSTIVLACNELTLRFTPDPDPECLDAGEAETVDLVYHVEQPAPQEATMAFRIDVPVVQCDVQIQEPPTVPAPPTLITQPGGAAGPAPTPTRIVEQEPAFVPPTSGDAGLLGTVGLDERPGGSGGPALLLTAGVLLGLSGAVAGGLHWSRRRGNNG